MTPEALELAVTVAMAELMLSGCTTTTDHHYVFPKGLENGIDIEVAAAKRLGLRVLLTRGSMNLSERDGGLPPDSVVQDEDAILADSKRVVDRYHETGEAAMTQIALAPCSPFSVTTVADALDRRSRRQARRAPAHASGRDRGREQILPANSTTAGRSIIWRTAAGSTTAPGSRTASISAPTEMPRLAKAGVSISHCACSQPDARLGLLPGVRSGSRRRARSASASTARPPTMNPISCRRCARPSCSSAPATASTR